MTGPLLELRGGHMVVFQVMASQVTLCLSPRSRSPLLGRASPLTPVVPVQQLDPAMLVVPFSSVFG